MLHAGVDIAASEREKLERLCRYISRPPVATERLALSASGRVRYALKAPYRDGTTHIVLEPLDFIARLAALVPALRRAWVGSGRGSGQGQGGADWEVPAEHISRRRSDRRGIRAAGLAKQGLSAAGSGSPWRPFHESTGSGRRFEIPIR